MNYYNEIEKLPAQWMRNLMAAGHIPNGVVDERDIRTVQPEDLAGYTQCHFFAGIAGWSEALRLSGWPADRPVWTGSCPCQPFSSAGEGKGQADERHLWPDWFKLIRVQHPVTVVGEQVASAIGHGWLDGVFADLEGEGYTCGAVVLGAHSVGAPHIRQRLYWMAVSKGEQFTGTAQSRIHLGEIPEAGTDQGASPGRSGSARGMADANGGQSSDGYLQRGGQHGQQQKDGRSGRLEHSPSDRRQQRRAEQQGLEGYAGHGDNGDQPGRLTAEAHGPATTASGSWDNYRLIPCADGKTRRIESCIQPLAHGVQGRVGRLRAYGNAIVPQVAAEFIGAFLDLEGGAK